MTVIATAIQRMQAARPPGARACEGIERAVESTFNLPTATVSFSVASSAEQGFATAPH
jgi:hypothetical protein